MGVHKDEVSPAGPVAAALAALRADPAAASGWCRLPFFAEGEADRIAAALDGGGAEITPPPADIFRALSLTPLGNVKAVILGQDPYPRPGDAHGLAFSFVGAGRMPPSLRTILAELAADLGGPVPARGDLSGWARQGVLLLNTALTTLAGTPGAHLRLGWSRLADEAVAAVSAGRPAVAFLLWGASARARAPLIDASRHLILASGHPSPLNRARDFPGTRPFSQSSRWLRAHGIEPPDWQL
ncbi:uracil-DNA glycosylase [Enterovirga sp.]|uniref:uracil-DNA glycosylase n=1 Tax=Enterovirga sp. TaxID=2026350 RepID=UPI002608C8D2|nr:uracil-DNA glycosylase [Enterovirga sp.]MDB5589900.1 uracil-DNA glycosylase [Enterovirga sp.]